MKCVYPGSFDPITKGHIDVIHRAARNIGFVIVAVGNNPAKKYLFNQADRIRLAKEALGFEIECGRVEVVGFDGLLADFAYESGAQVVVKGVRDAQDFDYERLLHEIGITQQHDIDTHILVASKRLNHVSSSAAKELCRHHGLIHDYVPLNVKEALEVEINDQLVFGVTGSVGVGKSYVTSCFVGYGNMQGFNIVQIDLDNLAHTILEEDPRPPYVEARRKIISTFDLAVEGDKMKVPRKQLGEIVFKDPAALAELNAIMRNPLMTKVREFMRGKRRTIFVLNGALLVEANLLPLCNNRVVVVDTPIEQQYLALEARGLTREQIERRVASQFTYSQKLQLAKEAVDRDDFGKVVPFLNDRTELLNVHEAFLNVFEGANPAALGDHHTVCD